MTNDPIIVPGPVERLQDAFMLDGAAPEGADRRSWEACKAVLLDVMRETRCRAMHGAECARPPWDAPQPPEPRPRRKWDGPYRH